jgi:hypothetical protein
MLRCFDASMLRCFDASMLHCFGASMLQCFDASMLRCLDRSMLQCFDASMPRCLDASMPRLHASAAEGDDQGKFEHQLSTGKKHLGRVNKHIQLVLLRQETGEPFVVQLAAWMRFSSDCFDCWLVSSVICRLGASSRLDTSVSSLRC